MYADKETQASYLRNACFITPTTVGMALNNHLKNLKVMLRIFKNGTRSTHALLTPLGLLDIHHVQHG